MMTEQPDTGNNLSDEEINASLERFNVLLDRGLENLSKIEIDEFSRGLSAEEVDDKLRADASLDINRSDFSNVRKFGLLKFDDTIQYIVGAKDQTIDDVRMEEIELLKDVAVGQKIAEYTITMDAPEELRLLLDKYNRSYQEIAGIVVKQTAASLQFYAVRKGKVVILQDMINIVPVHRDARCTVHTAPDLMTAAVDLVVAKGDGRKLSIALVLDALEKAVVLRGVDRRFLEQMVDKVNGESVSLSGLCAAKGQPAINGKDGDIHILFPTENPDSGFKILPDGRIDYRKQASIKMVQKDDCIATATDPEPGADGFDVTGKTIPGKNGTPATIFEGENVRKDPAGKRWYAATSGMLSFHDHVLSVFPVYHVLGDVDLKTGNITFNGSVLIDGNVRSGFEIRTTGDICVNGSTENARLEAGRDIRVTGAIVGGSSGSIKAGRNIFSGHIQNAHLEAQGDITIVRSCMHSTIFTTGKLFLHDRDGAVVGGVINAMQGVEAMSIGSLMGTHTEISVGTDFLILRKKQELCAIELYYKNNLQKIDTVLRPLMELVKKGIPLGSDKKRRLNSIVEKRTSMLNQLAKIQFRIKQISDVDPMAGNSSIVIQKNLYHDVVLHIAGATYHSKDTLREIVCVLGTDKKQIELKRLNMVRM